MINRRPLKRAMQLSLPTLFFLFLLSAGGTLGRNGQGGDERASRNNTGKQGAVIDLTGYWVSIIDEDWRWRMITPAKGDYASVPLNDEGTRVANAWDPAKDEAEGNQCRAYGAAGLMRIPERLHISWASDNTLKMEIDAGMQTRLFHFDGPKWQGSAPQWQGDSVAAWERQIQTRGNPPRFGGPMPGKGGTLQVVTTHMRPGYLRKNGVPYSGNAVLTEYYDRFDFKGTSYLIVTSFVKDPQYLTDVFITSGQFRQEPDSSKWNPTPCRPLWPLAVGLPGARTPK